MPRIDPTINLGHIISATVILLGGIGVHFDGKVSQARFDQRLHAVEVTQATMITTLQKVVETQASMAGVNQLLTQAYIKDKAKP